jgi:hypothetical protein
MTSIDISGTGLFSHTSQITHVFGAALKVVAGSVGIFILAFWLLIGIVIRSFYLAVTRRSVTRGAYSLLRSVAYGIGLILALFFVLFASVLFSIAWFKLLLVAVFITVVTAFIARETLIFLIIKRFGKYLFYFATLREIAQVISSHGNKEEVR